MRVRIGELEVEATPQELGEMVNQIVPETASEYRRRLTKMPETAVLPFGLLPMPRVLHQVLIARK